MHRASTEWEGPRRFKTCGPGLSKKAKNEPVSKQAKEGASFLLQVSTLTSLKDGM